MKIDVNWGKNVGEESRKTWQEKLSSGFFNKYMSGRGIDIGYAGYVSDVHPILPSAEGVDLNTPGYDGRTLPYKDGTLDYVYSSHFLEHVEDYKNAIREQHRVLKKGGYMIIAVPHRDLYEKKLTLPSRWNEDHKRFYTPASLLREIEESLEINTYRIRHLQDNDLNHNYNDAPEKHARWLYELEVVVQKI